MTQDQWSALLAQVAVPCLALATSAISYAALHAAAYLKTKNKSELISQVVGAAGRIAGDISDKLAALPAGTPFQEARRVAIGEGAQDLQARLPDAMKKLGISNFTAADMISGELGKLNANSPTANPVKSAVATLGDLRQMLVPAAAPEPSPNPSPPGEPQK